MADLTPEQIETIHQELDRYAWWLDDCIRIPGSKIRLGLDSIVGLIPGAGDLLTGGAALALVIRARQLGAPPRLIRRMLKNVAIDVVVGAIPLVGDVFDIAWQANRRNLKLLRTHFDVKPDTPSTRHGVRHRWLIASVLLVCAAGLVWMTR